MATVESEPAAVIAELTICSTTAAAKPSPPMVATRAIESPRLPWNSRKQRPMPSPRSSSTTAGSTLSAAKT